MNFICNSCKQGADLQDDLQTKRKHHQECKGGTWCDCQHRIQKESK